MIGKKIKIKIEQGPKTYDVFVHPSNLFFTNNTLRNDKKIPDIKNDLMHLNIS